MSFQRNEEDFRKKREEDERRRRENMRNGRYHGRMYDYSFNDSRMYGYPPNDSRMYGYPASSAYGHPPSSTYGHPPSSTYGHPPYNGRFVRRPNLNNKQNYRENRFSKKSKEQLDKELATYMATGSTNDQ